MTIKILSHIGYKLCRLLHAVRLVFNIRRTEQVTDSHTCLHWLRVAERIRLRMAAVMTYHFSGGLPPPYLDCFPTVFTMQTGRSGFRSAAPQRLSVPRSTLHSIDDRSFPVAGANVWNDLPSDVTSAPSQSTFRSRLKTHLFRFSYPDLVI
jgi:hypothetical protein